MSKPISLLIAISLIAACEPELPSLRVDLSAAKPPGTDVPGYRLRPIQEP